MLDETVFQPPASSACFSRRGQGTDESAAKVGDIGFSVKGACASAGVNPCRIYLRRRGRYTSRKYSPPTERSASARCQARLQFFGIAGGNLPFDGNIGIQLLHLRAADSRQKIRQAIVVAHFPVDVFDGIVFGLRGEIFGPSGPLFVVGGDHSAAACGDDLVAVEAEAGEVSETAQPRPL